MSGAVRERATTRFWVEGSDAGRSWTAVPTEGCAAPGHSRRSTCCRATLVPGRARSGLCEPAPARTAMPPGVSRTAAPMARPTARSRRRRAARSAPSASGRRRSGVAPHGEMHQAVCDDEQAEQDPEHESAPEIDDAATHVVVRRVPHGPRGPHPAVGRRRPQSRTPSTAAELRGRGSSERRAAPAGRRSFGTARVVNIGQGHRPIGYLPKRP